VNGAGVPRLSIGTFRAERILYDEGGLLVVDKPPGIPTYGGDESLRHGLTQRLGDFLEARGRSPRLGVHQRLDQDTSGALLLTTDPAQDASIEQALAARELGRTYRAVVDDPKTRLVDAAIELLLDDDGKRSRVVAQGGKSAVTEVRVLERVGTRADVELRLQTGRLHQIRVTLAHLGAPVLGDRLYGGQPASRLFLHAWRLSGGPLRAPLEAPLPRGFESALQGRGATLEPTELRSVLGDAACKRAPLLAQTSAFRLLAGEADGARDLRVDVYGLHAHLSWAAASRPQPEVLEALVQELLGLGLLGVWAAPRETRGSSGAAEPASEGTWYGARPSAALPIEEHGQFIELPSLEGASALWPLELRELRRRAVGWAASGSVLAGSAAVGSIGLFAARGGAAVTLVDRSAQALGRLGALASSAAGSLRLLSEEPLSLFEREGRRGSRYALVVLDLLAARGEGPRARLLRAALGLVTPGGKLLVARRPSSMAARHLRRLVHEAAESTGRTVRFAKEVPRSLDVEAPEISDLAEDLPPRALIVELE